MVGEGRTFEVIEQTKANLVFALKAETEITRAVRLAYGLFATELRIEAGQMRLPKPARS